MITYIQAIEKALYDSMRKDNRIFLIGEDLKHSTFGVTDRLAGLFPNRVLSTPISENAIIGVALGAAMTGLIPVVEIMFYDFIYVCMDGIVNQIPKIKFLRPDINMHIVIRAPIGAGLNLGCQHSQANAPIFMQLPGWYIIVPYSAADAYFLLKYAVENPGIYLYFEHKGFYYDTGELNKPAQFGKAKIINEGKDITIIGYQYGIKVATKLIEELKYSIEVIDLRTLNPLDIDTCLKSIKKTGRLVVIEESYYTNGVGAEVIAKIAEKAMEFLKAPPLRIANKEPCISYKNDFKIDMKKTVKTIRRHFESS